MFNGEKMNIGFIGLGTMGYHMAGQLAANGRSIAVFNRTKERAKQWSLEHKGNVCDSIQELSQTCDIILTCVGNDDDVREIYYSDTGILHNAKEHCILIDHTTTSATLAKELYSEAKAKNIKFIDAPVSGGEIGAINGQLSVMIGGEASVVTEVLPILNIFSKAVTHIGNPGSGQLCKMANQICIAGILQGLSEAILLAEASNLDIALVKEAISGGAAGSWQLSNRMETMHDRKFNFGFAIDWMRKDLAFCLDEANGHNLDLHCTKHVDKTYEKLQLLGENRADTSALVKQFDKKISIDQTEHTTAT